jgi:hypothetical protein
MFVSKLARLAAEYWLALLDHTVRPEKSDNVLSSYCLSIRLQESLD